MKTEDEVYLSAYLDGELDLEQRSSVEAAMLSNPALAERLRQLTAVRDMVASLPRPSLQEDLSAVIVARTTARVPGTLPSRLKSLPLARIAGAAAALILLSVGLTRFSTQPAPRPQVHHPRALVAVAPEPQAQPRSDRPVDSQAPVALAGNEQTTPALRPPGAIAAPRDEADLQADRDQIRIRELLDSPDLRHVFLVVDEIGGGTLDRVEGLVRRTPRVDPVFGKITVSQGIVIDPDHPSEATVFAVVMNPQEVKEFRNQLKKDFPTLFEETTPDPSVLTQLSGIGQIAVLPGTRAATTQATELAAAPAAAPAPPPASETPRSALRTPATPRNAEVVLQSSPEFDGMPVRVVPRRPPPSADNVASGTSAPSDPTKAGSESPALAKAESSSEDGDPKASNVVFTEEASQHPSSIVLVWVALRDLPVERQH